MSISISFSIFSVSGSGPSNIDSATLLAASSISGSSLTFTKLSVLFNKFSMSKCPFIIIYPTNRDPLAL